MHINSNRIGQVLTPKEKAHLAQCPLCQFEHDSLSELSSAAQELTLLAPPDSDWEMIKQRTNKQPSLKPRRFKQYLTGLAASGLLTAFSWLMWNNYQLQSQLTLVLNANQQLEQQIHQAGRGRYQQSQLLLKVRQVEQQLVNEESLDKKVTLLEQRHLLLKEMVKSKGQSYEFSI